MRAALQLALLLAVAANASSSIAAQRTVTPADDVSAVFAAAQPEDVIVMADGAWNNVALHLEGSGTAEQPITLRAQTPGRVVVTGKSHLRLSGRHLVVEGLFFQDIVGESEVIALRTSSAKHAHDCRLTNCAIINRLGAEGQIESKWVSVYGTNNRVDHCHFSGKNSRGTTLVVWVGDGPDDHRIDHNYFGHRPPLGVNGGESVRVGTSDVSMNDSRTIVESNVFEECDGEAEIISNKSCENVYRGNTFLRCAGALTLRHGNRSTVEGNYFLGEGKRLTGGVRVIGDDHRVVNNYFEGLTGDESRSAISFMNGIVRSPLSGYFQVHRAEIAFNTLIDCKYPIAIGVGAGTKQSLAPESCIVANNVFIGDRPVVRQYAAPVDWTWTGNLRQTEKPQDDDPPGVKQVALRFARDKNNLWRPQSDSPVIAAAVGDFPHVTRDIDGQPRGPQKDVGCDQFHEAAAPAPLLPKDVGPTWWPAVETDGQ